MPWNHVWRDLARLNTDECAAAAIEYAMIAAAIGGTLAATVYTLGGDVESLYTSISGLFS